MENLGIEGKLLIAQLINFVLFFYIFKKYIVGPFVKFLNQERKNEKEKEELLERLKKGEEELLVKEEKMKDKVRKEKEELLDKVKKEAQSFREEILGEAKKEAEIIKAKARKEVEEERSKLYQDVKNKVADLSVLMVEKALRDFLDEESRKKITSYILKNLNNTVSSHEN